MLPATRPAGETAPDQPSFQAASVPRASELESFVVWDSRRRSSITLDVASYPCTSKAASDARLLQLQSASKSLQGQWETLMRVGEVLAQVDTVRIILSDSHGSHGCVSRALLGLPLPLPGVLLRQATYNVPHSQS